jgi:hypothetical protein
MQNDEFSKKTEEFNEFMLKQAAITISSEGVSRDLKAFIQKKIHHDEMVLTQASQMLTAMVSSESEAIRESVLKKGNPIHKLLDHALKEIRITDVALNIAIQSMLSKEDALASEIRQEPKSSTEEGADKDGVAS